MDEAWPPRRALPWLLVLAALTLAALAGRLLLSPRPLDPATVPSTILQLRSRIALGGLVLGAGAGLAAVVSQAQARDPRVDASLAGPLWGALPGLLVPGPVWLQATVCLAGALVVTRLTARGGGGLPMVLTRGVAAAGLIVSLAALLLFLGPGLTASTALALLHAGLGGALPSVTLDRVLLGALLVAGAALLALTGWRGLLLARTGLARPGGREDAVVALASAGAVLVAGVVPGIGLLAVAAVRRGVGEHPLRLVPAGMLSCATLALVLDGVAQAWAWPGELPVGVVTAVLASGYLAWEVMAR